MITHSFECAAHGVFEKRIKAGTIPRCPKGCSKSFVKLVFLTPIGHVSGRTRKADALVREAAASQGLSDISTSPSRPGGTVAERNRMRNPQLPEAAQARAVSFKDYIGALTHKQNSLSDMGFGHTYNKAEWKKDPQSGKMRHVGFQSDAVMPMTSVERVRE